MQKVRSRDGESVQREVRQPPHSESGTNKARISRSHLTPALKAAALLYCSAIAPPPEAIQSTIEILKVREHTLDVRTFAIRPPGRQDPGKGAPQRCRLFRRSDRIPVFGDRRRAVMRVPPTSSLGAHLLGTGARRDGASAMNNPVTLPSVQHVGLCGTAGANTTGAVPLARRSSARKDSMFPGQ